MAGSLVPQVTSLDEIYAPEALLSQGKRWNELAEKFQSLYGKNPDFIARAPGRVNIIGEHIDYMLYEVLPMAVAIDLLVAVAVVPTPQNSEPTVEIANLAGKFTPKKFTVPTQGHVEIDNDNHHWTNYFKCGIRGALELLRNEGWNGVPASLQVLVHGTIPAGGGLSSSAAFTCASALAVLTANGRKEVEKSKLVNLAVVSERFVGVNSGG
ncbi:Galactokinase [Arthrobotrys entomopaga]|nr:Galactokinase [Arthrobotrys entomopaga]